MEIEGKIVMQEQVSMQIMMRLRQIIQGMAKHSKHIQESYKVTVPQLICLREVYEQGPISIGALTKILYLNHSSLTGIVDRLEKKGFLKRNRISKDRRQVHLEITTEGVQFIQTAPTPLQERFVEQLDKLDDEKVTMILWSLEKLVDMLAPGKISSEISSPLLHIAQIEGEITPQEEI